MGLRVRVSLVPNLRRAARLRLRGVCGFRAGQPWAWSAAYLHTGRAAFVVAAPQRVPLGTQGEPVD